MAINSITFLCIYILILIAYWLIPGAIRVYFLLPVSLGFYLLWDVKYAIALLAVILVSYGAGLGMERQGISPSVRKALFAISTGLLVLALLSIRILPFEALITPIGFSFYTLQAIGYLADVYRKKVPEERDLFLYALFISFFPTVMAGPIQRADGLLNLFHKEPEFEYASVRRGLYMVAFGFFTKNFVADRLGYLVDKAYGSYAETTGFVLALAVILYAFQLYCDFLGYSLIACGIALTLGFPLKENFRQPYFSTSIREFWSRWHISLSTWLRDYVYFPLGGSRKGLRRTLINLLIVFLVSGIWHGRGLTFLVWGLIHGLYNVAEKLIFRKTAGETGGSAGIRVLRILVTFILVDLAWLFFRADSLNQAFTILYRIFFENGFLYALRTGSYAFGVAKKELLLWFLGLGVVFAVDLIHEKGISLSAWIGSRPVVLRWAFYLVFLTLLAYAGVYYYGTSAANFIYAGF